MKEVDWSDNTGTVGGTCFHGRMSVLDCMWLADNLKRPTFSITFYLPGVHAGGLKEILKAFKKYDAERMASPYIGGSFPWDGTLPMYVDFWEAELEIVQKRFKLGPRGSWRHERGAA